MQNTDYCLSCDAGERTRVISILGKPVRVKNYICSADGHNYQKKPESNKLQVSVCPTSYCAGHCPFCIAKDTQSKRKLDVRKFTNVMQMLKAEDCVRGIRITGGEPFYDADLLDEVVSTLYAIFGYETEISISTNGMWLDQMHKIKDLSYLESIHISRHHYDDAINRSLFGGASVPSGAKLKEIVDSVSFKDIFVFNCMLLKDYINSPEQAHRFLDFAIEVGVPKVGFMDCVPINVFAAQQTIPYETVLREDDPSILFTRRFFDYDICHCRDGVYVSDEGKIVEFYGRSTKMSDCGYARGLVYDADNHLKAGFDGEIII